MNEPPDSQGAAPPPLIPHVVPHGQRRSESELRRAVAAWLRGQGLHLAGRVVCLAGEPDLITVDHGLIVECKHQLSRKALFQALGQILLYRQAINPHARALVVGYCTPEALALVPLIAQLGVTVLCWDDRDMEAGGHKAEGEEALTGELLHEDGAGGAPLASTGSPLGTALPVAPATMSGRIPLGSQGDTPHGAGIGTMEDEGRRRRAEDPRRSALHASGGHGAGNSTMHMSSSTSSISQPTTISQRTLHWKVAQLAQARGHPTVARLAAAAGMNRQGLYRIWHNIAGQVSLEVLARLAIALSAAPGDWFTWTPTREGPVLAWTVAEHAQSHGLDITSLSFRAGVHLSSLRAIWDGTAKAVTPTTLGKLAIALDELTQPFTVGELFYWGDQA